MPPPLSTRRLTLIPLLSASPEQHDSLAEAWDDPEVFRFIGAGRPGFTRADLERGLTRFREHHADRAWGPLVVVRTADGAVLGETGLYAVPDSDEIELGHRYGRASWGQGYGFEAAVAVMAWAGELGLSSLVSIIQEGNLASRRIAEKLGFTLRERRDHPGYADLWYSWSAPGS